MRNIINLNGYKVADILVEYEEYDSRFCRNGGSYYQPTIKLWLVGRHGAVATIVVNDTSCGDFGSRYHIAVRFESSGIKFSGAYDSVGYETREWSDIPWEVANLLEWAFHEAGCKHYYIPVKEVN